VQFEPKAPKLHSSALILRLKNILNSLIKIKEKEK
jgi:hypothetical protein